MGIAVSCRKFTGILSGVAALILLLAAGGARAQGCHGTLVASALRPPAKPLVIWLELRDPSEQNKALAALFVNGMRAAGAKVDAKATMRMHLNYHVLGGQDPQTGWGGVEHSVDTLRGFSDVGTRMLPTMPSQRFGRPAPPPTPAVLFLRVELTPIGSDRVDWIASVQCQMGTATPEELASQMGRLIGGLVGQTTQQVRF